ncbi:MAG: ABC transporter permease [Candidatus Omnitrophica bacterium]|nr:ABC transporter permease [Candidatus Omnitrophota bacterium]
MRKKVFFFFNWLIDLGAKSLDLLKNIGGIFILFMQVIRATFARPFRVREMIHQMNLVGVKSFPLVFLTAIFTGMVLALQSAYQLKKFSALQFTADLVSLSITRELGPVLTAMVVAGRVGAGMTAELGTMKVTEQIDALRSLATDPVRYLAVPRVMACFFMMFILTVYADFIGIAGGYVVSIFKLGLSSDQYLNRLFIALYPKDVFTGLIKAFSFGLVVSIVGCYYGFQAKGGAEGVGRATTLSVVTSLITIIALDCFFTALFFFAG